MRVRPDLYFRLPLDPARLLRARHRIRDYLHEGGLATTVIEDVVLAVEEAMTNAVRHSGARQDLHVLLSFRGDDLIASVRDQGKGFEVGDFDPRRLPDLDKSSGRGLYLISRLMDDVELRRRDGLEVWMAKRDALAGPAPSPGRALGVASPPGAQVHRDMRERAMLDEIDDAFLAFDWEYRLIHVNQAALRLIDRPSQELLGHTLWSLFPYAPPHPAGDAALRAMQLGAPSTVEYESHRTGRWVKLRTYPAAFGISVFARDISERKRNERAQERQNLALRGVNAILQASLTTATEEELGGVCLRVAEALTDSPLGLIARLSEDGLLHDVAVSEPGRSSCSMDDQSGHHRSQEGFSVGGLHGQVIVGGETVIANAPSGHPDSSGVPVGHPELTAYLGVPLKDQGRTIGLVAVANREGGYGDEQRDALESLAPSMAEAFQRKRSEEALQANEERLRALVTASSEVLYRMSPDWSEMCELHSRGSLADTERPSRTWLQEYIHPADQSEIMAVVEEAMRTKSVFDMEHRVLQADGTTGWVHSRAVPLLDAEGEIAEWYGAASDITERKCAEAALRESERRFSSLFESMLEGVVLHELVYDRDGEAIDYRVLDVNPAFQRQTGLERDRVRGQLASELYGTGVPPYLAEYVAVVESGEPNSFESYFPPLQKHFQISAVAPMPGHFATIFEDITERKTAEETLRQSEA